MTLTARLRRLWLDAHLWIGVGLLIAFIPLGVTGSILVWHAQLDRALYADRYATTGPTASRNIKDYAQAAEAAFAGRAQLTQIRLPQTPGDPVVAVGRLHGPTHPNGRPRTMNAWIDPPTARVLSTGEVAKTFTMQMHILHGTLMIPGIGRKVVGWLGWAMFISCATGLWLWWPRRGGFLKGLRWRRGASTLFNLHHMVGFWICIPLAVLSLTGVYISFPQTSRAVFGVAQPPTRNGPGRFAPPLSETKLTLEQAIRAAGGSAAIPLGVREVNYPTQGRAPAWRIVLNEGDPSEARSTVRVIDATGEVKNGPDLPNRAQDRGAGPPDQLSPLMRRIHDGNDLGLAWQLIIFAGGLAPAVLGVTGLVMWLRRRGRRRAITRGLA